MDGHGYWKIMCVQTPKPIGIPLHLCTAFMLTTKSGDLWVEGKKLPFRDFGFFFFNFTLPSGLRRFFSGWAKIALKSHPIKRFVHHFCRQSSTLAVQLFLRLTICECGEKTCSVFTHSLCSVTDENNISAGPVPSCIQIRIGQTEPLMTSVLE